MRVAVHVRDLAPEVGGGHTYESDVLDALAGARGATAHEVIAVGYAPQPPKGWDVKSYFSLRAGLPARAAGKVRHKVTSALWRGGSGAPRSRVDRLFDSHAIDLVWCLGAATPTRALPYVTTIWDLQHRIQPVFPEVGSGSEWAARESFYRREIGQATAVIVGTGAGQDEVERFYGVPPERIRKLPHPTPSFALDAEVASDDAALARYGLEPGYVLYPAQFWAHKNHVGLLHALRLLRDDHGVRLPAVFVGSDKGNQAHVRQVAATMGLTGQVHFLGFVPRSDLVALYRNAFALAYVTFFGPENLPPLEAFALGCPVVASDVAGASEQLGDSAMLVPPTDESRIAEALLALHRDEALRQHLVERGRERARAFTATHFAKGMFDIMDEIELVVRTWR
jgi:glycosyltransferase involved in cell wall biosynthesis